MTRYTVSTKYSDCSDSFVEAEFDNKADAVRFFNEFDIKGMWEVENSCSGNRLARSRVNLSIFWDEFNDGDDYFEVTTDGDERTYFAMVHVVCSSRESVAMRPDEFGQWDDRPIVLATIYIDELCEGSEKPVADDYDLSDDPDCVYDELAEEFSGYFHSYTMN